MYWQSPEVDHFGFLPGTAEPENHEVKEMAQHCEAKCAHVLQPAATGALWRLVAAT